MRSGFVRAAATVSGTPGQPGAMVRYPAAWNRPAHSVQDRGCSHRPWMKMTGIGVLVMSVSRLIVVADAPILNGSAAGSLESVDWSVCVQAGGELGAGGDIELGEDAVQVRADGAVGEVELLADLPVSQPVGGHLGDLQFLRGELITCPGHPRTAVLTRGTQLLARAFPPG